MAGPGAAPARERLAYDYYVVVLLAVAYMLSFLDRTLISLLIGPIKAEFLLSDTQVGLLIGFGFVIFYSVLGLPFGTLADRVDRRGLILAGLVAWSVATAASGLAGGFAMLAALRALVGVGEATLAPSAYSTLADRFPRERLGLAIAVYAAGVSVGGGLAMMFGGVLVAWAAHAGIVLPLVGTITGWRLAMMAVGLLGLPLALLIALTLREAPRLSHASAPPFSELVRYVARRPAALIGTLAAFSFANVANYVAFLWVPALFMRVHGMDARTTGLVIGAIVGVCGTIGMVGSGAIADRWARRHPDATIRVTLWALVAQLPLMPAAFLVHSPVLAAVLLAPAMAATTAASSVQGTALQLMTPARMRGRMIAIYLLCVTLVGMGLGPLTIGLLSDHVFTAPGGLGPSMALVAAAGLIVSLAILVRVRPAALRTIVALRAATA